MSIKDDCYALVQRIVVSRDVYCRFPGCGKRSTAGHHVFKRDNMGTAFDVDLVVGLCEDHHVPWAHGKKYEFTDWVMRYLGSEAYYEGLERSRQIVKHVDYPEIKKHLTILLTKYRV
jgi:hypothetical protein